MNWIPLTSYEQLEAISDRSKDRLCLIFKHSVTCNISMMAKSRLEKGWSFGADEIETYFLNIQANRAISKEIGDRFEVFHESPQALLIHHGSCIYDASHLDIDARELKSVISGISELNN